jgi:hypothetical protein
VATEKGWNGMGKIIASAVFGLLIGAAGGSIILAKVNATRLDYLTKTLDEVKAAVLADKVDQVELDKRVVRLEQGQHPATKDRFTGEDFAEAQEEMLKSLIPLLVAQMEDELTLIVRREIKAQQAQEPG